MKVKIDRGTLIKIYDGEYYNQWGTIIKRIGDNIDVVLEKRKKIINISIDSIKWAVGTLSCDYLGLGKYRHNNEVKREILRVLKLFPAE